MAIARPAPRVSVVVPNYNYAGTLPLCLESVLAQTYPPHEVIVVDDASTDGSREVAARYSCRVIGLERNGGVSAARNRGVAESTGEIVFFVDSDVALAPDAVEQAVRELRADPSLGCVYGVVAPEPLVDDGVVERYRVLHAHHWQARSVGRVHTAIFMMAAMPRAVFDEVGPFDANLRDSEDVEYSERLAPRHAILLTDAISGRHDEVDRLGPLLAEQFRRAQLLVPVAAIEKHNKGRGLKANSPLGAGAAWLAAVLLLGTALSPWCAIAALFLAGASIAADPGLYRSALRRRGPGFLAVFTLIHYLVQVTLITGAMAGAVRWVIDPSFGPGPRRDSVRATP
ncbi:glycosyltransferase family 2 protein [Myceligenerans xiligouense]|uniref:Glycosyl transferase family 2 n=1 Tax=Myceligenerans xiligouense TaxID=253184 RepID=A0A3N4YM55_9MICO|nr:glycosyltransferase [Myceligenerans xiligouense]RPF21207.1 glycosyl transferase family 2 [Myceligenerans xiligouense]